MATGWSPNCSTRCRCHERDELGTRRRRSATPPTPRIGITRRPSDSWALGSLVHSAIVRSVGGVAPTCGWRGVGGVAPTYGDAMSDGIVPTLPELVALRAAAQGRRPPRERKSGVSWRRVTERGELDVGTI